MRFILNPVQGIKQILQSLDTLKRLRATRQVLQKMVQPQRKKDYTEMSSEEFYRLIVDPRDARPDAPVFYQFFLDYFITGYLNGDFQDVDIERLIGFDNPLQLNRYVERMIRTTKMQGSLLDELEIYSKTVADPTDITALVTKAKAAVHNFIDVQRVIRESTEAMRQERQKLKAQGLIQAEQERQSTLAQQIALHNPEAVHDVGQDTFRTEEADITAVAQVMAKELDTQRRGVVIRKARQEEHRVINKDLSQMTPSEQIAYKKKILGKLRQDVNKGMNIKI